MLELTIDGRQEWLNITDMSRYDRNLIEEPNSVEERNSLSKWIFGFAVQLFCIRDDIKIVTECTTMFEPSTDDIRENDKRNVSATNGDRNFMMSCDWSIGSFAVLAHSWCQLSAIEN